MEKDKKLMSKRLNRVEKIYEEAVRRVDALIDMKSNNPEFLSEDKFMKKKQELTLAKDRAAKAVQKFNEDHNDGVEQTLEVLNFCM